MTNTTLPPHLLALFQSNPEMAEVGKNIHNEAHAKIRYNGSKWKLLPAAGEEIAVTTPNLDVIIIDINEHKTHVVYDKAYDPKGEPEAPVWQSDDGTPVPAEHETKVVSDYRRVAVLIAENPEGGIYELRISAGSLTNFDRYVTAIKNFGAPIGSLVTRITFDASFDYPKLVFTPAAYLSEVQGASLAKSFSGQNKQHVLSVIGKRKEATALPAPAPVAALPSPAITLPVQEATILEPKRRGRKAAEAPAPVAQPSIVMPMVSPVQTAAASVVTKPQAASADLEGLLANIMGGR